MKKVACLLALSLFAASASAEVTRKCNVDGLPKEVTFITGKELNAKAKARGRKSAYDPKGLWVSLRMNTSPLMFRVEDAVIESGEMTADTWRSFFMSEASVKATSDEMGRVTIVARTGIDWVDEEENARLGRRKN